MAITPVNLLSLSIGTISILRTPVTRAKAPPAQAAAR
jgi:hypothetical protein